MRSVQAALPARAFRPEIAIVEDYQADDAVRILACLRASFGGVAHAERWRHLHFANPAGPSLMVLARADDAVVGQIASLRRRVRFFGTEHTIAHVVDTMVHPAWQRRGVFRTLVTASERAVERAGLNASYGVANDVARHASVKYEQRRPLGTFPVLARPLRPLASLAALCRHYVESASVDPLAIPECAASGPLASPRDAPSLTDTGAGAWTAPCFDDRHSRLFARATDLPPIVFVRDAAHLAWRYPASASGVYAQRDVADGDELAATAIVRLVAVAGLRYMFLMEWHWREGATDAARGVLNDVLTLARASGAHGVAAMAARGSVPRRILRSSGFLAVPARALPQGAWPGLHARGPFARDFRWADGTNWHFTWGDGLVL